MVRRQDIVEFLDDLLDINDVSDHSVNGLQVQGGEEVRKVGLAVDAALSVYERAIAEGCQMLVVHHGLIWGGLQRITDRNHAHVSRLIHSGLNLYAAHLPLDMSPDVGNNALLCQMAGLVGIEPFGAYHGAKIGWKGALEVPCGISQFEDVWREQLGATPRTLPFGPELIRTVAIVSGGGTGALKEAIDEGIDCFVSGEGPHEKYHEALEGGIHLMYLGHYLTETVGVQAVGRALTAEFPELSTVFIDEPTGF
ncbi:MAG: Nif3-like dinuclear metal center hexameric protein [Proteobacteria bacterium]|nr:Nif3-like dinuclear metal center hexameric protein [Pseudomonadota bacterium]